MKLPRFTSSNAAPSIVVAVLPGTVLRYDISTEKLSRFPRKIGTDAAMSVATALQDKAFGRNSRGIRSVMVMSSDFFTQKVSLPAVQTNGLPPEQLSAALRYEVEPFSNIATGKGKLAFTETSGSSASTNRSWNVLHIADTDIAAICTAIREAGFRCCAIASHGELTEEADDALLAELFRKIANDSRCGTADVPVIHPDQKSEKRAFLTAALYASILLAVAVHFAFQTIQMRSLRNEVKARERVQAEKSNLEKQLRGLGERMKTLQRVRKERTDTIKAIDRKRNAWPNLLKTLSSDFHNNAVLQAITSEGRNSVRIEGLVIGENSAASILARMNRELSDSGWTVAPERLSFSDGSPDLARPVRFTLRAEFPDSVIEEGGR